MKNKANTFFWNKRKHRSAKTATIFTGVAAFLVILYFFVSLLWFFLVVSPVERQRVEPDLKYATLAGAVLADESISPDYKKACGSVAEGEVDMNNWLTCRKAFDVSCSERKYRFACDLQELHREREISRS